MQFISVIKDECGDVVRICRDYTYEENEAFLASRPECHYGTVPVDDYGDYL